MGTGLRRLGGCSATLGVLCALGAGMESGPARAYSSFPDYVRPIQEGGGGGRLFTGTPSDGYGCDVCHRGAEGAALEVVGLPVDGYVPGQSYEITLRWPDTAPHVAMMAEFTDLSGQPAGATALVPYASWTLGERCENGFPAADVCRADGAASGCCRELEPMRDACSYPGVRSVVWVLECGSRLARLVWTAPSVAAGDVWFSTQMVTSDLMNDAVGDGVTAVRMRIPFTGAAVERSAAVGDCSAASGTPPASRLRGDLTLLPWLLLIWGRRRARHGRARATRKSPLADIGK